MGISNLRVLITKYSPDAIRQASLEEYRGKIVAIDISIYLYRAIYTYGDPIETLIKQAMRLMKNGIIPVYVFDGKPPAEKKPILDKRKEDKLILVNAKNDLKVKLEAMEQAMAEIEIEISKPVEEKATKEAISKMKQDIKDIDKKIIYVTSAMIIQCKNVFNLMGVPYIEADGEAEWLCAYLCRIGVVDMCLSEDMDILANGGKIFLRNFNQNSNKIIEYNLAEILKGMEITYDMFIDICILCGCDYTTTIRNIGVERAYKYIKITGSIEGVINFVNAENAKCIAKNKPCMYDVPADFDYKSARRLFKMEVSPEKLEEMRVGIKLRKPNIEGLIKYTMNECECKDNTKVMVVKHLGKLYESIVAEMAEKDTKDTKVENILI